MNFLYKYDEAFYRYINRGSLDSAAVVVPLLLHRIGMELDTVLDVGCGAGAWLQVWKAHGASIKGLDGDYLNPASLLIDEQEFQPLNVAEAFQLDRRYELAQCLEVAEHIEPAASAQLVSNLCGHADLVLFSAAPPGQGGENHQNEQPYAYWRTLFQEQGFQLYDPIRGELADNKTVMPWYRYNTFLFVKADRQSEIHARLAAYQVNPLEEPADIAPLSYRLRRRLLALLPVSVISAMAVVKKGLAIRMQEVPQ